MMPYMEQRTVKRFTIFKAAGELKPALECRAVMLTAPSHSARHTHSLLPLSPIMGRMKTDARHRLA